MKNGQLPTWFVVKWLKEHSEEFEADASENEDDFRVEAHRLDDSIRFCEHVEFQSGTWSHLPLRDDWTIRYASGLPVDDRDLQAADPFKSFVQRLLDKAFHAALRDFK